MRNLIIGLIVGVVVAVPVSGFAWSVRQQATPTFGAGCSRDVDSSTNYCDVSVDRYKDGQNTCYIARTNVSSGRLPDIALSCVGATK